MPAVRPKKKPAVSRRRPEPDADDAIFKALANADRRAILDFVKQAPRTTGSLCEHLQHLDRCTVMLHLRVLEDAQLILARKKGRERWNYLNCEPIQRIYGRWIQQYAEPAAQLLTKLKQQLESE